MRVAFSTRRHPRELCTRAHWTSIILSMMKNLVSHPNPPEHGRASSTLQRHDKRDPIINCKGYQPAGNTGLWALVWLRENIEKQSAVNIISSLPPACTTFIKRLGGRDVGQSHYDRARCTRYAPSVRPSCVDSGGNRRRTKASCLWQSIFSTRVNTIHRMGFRWLRRVTRLQWARASGRFSIFFFVVFSGGCEHFW